MDLDLYATDFDATQFTKDNYANTAIQTSGYFGRAQSAPLSMPARGPKKLLMGIIEGPPPVPNENLNIPYDRITNTALNTASLAVDFSGTKSGGTTGNWSLGMTLQASAEAEEGAWMQAELEADYKGMLATNNGATSSIAWACTLYKNGAIPNVYAEPLGALVLYGPDLTGTSYKYVDPNGITPPGAPAYTAFVPAGDAFSTETYFLNPNTVRPGDLVSYGVNDPDDIQRLNDASVIEFAPDGSSPTRYITDDVSLASSQQSGFTRFASNDNGFGFSIDLKTAGGVQGKAFGYKAKAGGGLHLTTDWMWDTSSESSHGITSNVDMRTDYTTRSYTSWGWHTYMLKPDKTYTDQLLDTSENGIGLITPSWPPRGSYAYRENKRIRDMLEQTSSPWKVTYVVVDPQFNDDAARLFQANPVGSARSRRGRPRGIVSGAPLVLAAPYAGLQAKLRNMGFVGTAQVQLLLDSIRNPDASKRAEASATLQRSLTAQRGVRRTMFHGMMDFSPSELDFLRARLNDLEAERLAAWKRAHPNRRPRF